MKKSQEQPYNLELAQKEAQKMQEKIQSGEAKTYNEAEKLIDSIKGSENKETLLKNIKIKEYFSRRGLMYNVSCPREFIADIKGNLNLEKIINKLKLEIPKYYEIDSDHEGRPLFREHVRVSSSAIDEENKVAAFVLLNESFHMGGMSWDEVVYGIKVNDDGTIIGELINGNYGSYTDTGFEKEEINPGSRLTIANIKEGVLSYVFKSKDGDSRGEYDLKNMRHLKLAENIAEKNRHEKEYEGAP